MNALTAFLKQQITKNLGGASAAGNGARKISQWLLVLSRTILWTMPAIDYI
jgi:hypothetical protein